jgi:hypothetical protein
MPCLLSRGAFGLLVYSVAMPLFTMMHWLFMIPDVG